MGAADAGAFAVHRYLYDRADELLYYGKEHGRDQIVMESREEES